MAANDVPCCEVMFWVYLVISVSLVCFAGLMSGLTLGLMSLSLVDLEVLSKAGRPQDRKNAEKILPLVKNQHLLLCTLLIGNAMAMEALPIFLDALLPAWGAILISVTLILAFGEIIPQAVCSRYGLSVGSKLSVVVRIIVILIFPLAYPISKLLDWVLGEKHSALLRRAELKILVDLHGNEAGKGGELTRDETTIIAGALNMTQKTAKDAMTPISKSFSLDINSRLDEKTMGEIISKGHSRVPIYSGTPTNVIGLILVKNLIKSRPEDETPIRELTIRRIPRVYDNLPLYDILNQFQKGHSHMAVVVKSKIDEADQPKTNTATTTGYIKSNNNLPPKQATKGACEKEELSISINSFPVYSCDNEMGSPIRNMNAGYNKDHWNISCQDLEFLSISNSDVEVIGIITLEDVMEELLQEEIFDETDEYVDIHNKITINMVPLRRSELASPKASPLASPGRQWRSSSSVASPLSSSYSASPILNSPIPPHFQSPFMTPTLSSSPTKINSTPPITTLVSTLHFPSSPNRVSRKPYEKLKKANHT